MTFSRNTLSLVFVGIIATCSAFVQQPLRKTFDKTTFQYTPKKQASFLILSATDSESSEPKPLDIVEEGGDASVDPDVLGSQQSKQVVKNLGIGKGGEETELNFFDPAMSANTNPFQLSWWGYILFAWPAILLADDIFHFLPKDMPNISQVIADNFKFV